MSESNGFDSNPTLGVSGSAPSGALLLGFRVGPEHPWLALAAGTLAELLIDYSACPLPGAPPALRQIVVIRGILLPVFDLCTALGWPRIEKPRILAIGRGDRAAALLIHGEPQVLDVDTTTSPPNAETPPPALSAFVRPALTRSGEPVWQFAHEAWFAQAARLSRPTTDAATAHSQRIPA